MNSNKNFRALFETRPLLPDTDFHHKMILEYRKLFFQDSLAMLWCWHSLIYPAKIII